MWLTLKKQIVLFLCVCCACLPVFVPVAAQTQELDKLSSTINDELMSLQTETESLKEQLTLVCADLKASQKDATKWEEASSELNDSLMSINDELTKSYESLNKYKQSLKTHQKYLTIMTLIVFVLMFGKVLGFILYKKGIKVPRWLDILL